MNPLLTAPLFIVNPIAGTKHKKELPFPNTVFTEGKGDATRLAKEAVARGVTLVVAVGGDGTVNEVAQALVNTPATLGIIPFGSGNALARHLGIPLDPLQAYALLETGTSRLIDTFLVNGHLSVAISGCGFDARVSQKFATYPKRGLTSYLRAALAELPHLGSPITYELEVDGEPLTVEASLICFANTAQYGHNIYIAPQASSSDGLLDLVILHPFSPTAIPRISLELLARQLTHSKNISSRTCKEVKILSPSELLMHIDGDPASFNSPVTVSIQPKSLRVLAL